MAVTLTNPSAKQSEVLLTNSSPRNSQPLVAVSVISEDAGSSQYGSAPAPDAQDAFVRKTSQMSSQGSALAPDAQDAFVRKTSQGTAYSSRGRRRAITVASDTPMGKESALTAAFLVEKKASGWRLPLLLLVAAATASAVSFAVDTGIGVLREVKLGTQQAAERAGVSTLYVSTTFSVACAIVARLLCQLDMAACGSGVPEVKCLLSVKGNDHLFACLKPVVCFAKAVGFAFASASGLPLGKEGPFVHIAACISTYLSRMPFFQPFKNTHAKADSHILLAAVTVGVGATFASPVGGVLFAIELILPHMYDFTAYWGCFFAAVVGGYIYSWLKMTVGAHGMKPVVHSDLTPMIPATITADLVFTALCFIIAVMCGLLGAAFVKFHRHMAKTMALLRNYKSDRLPDVLAPGLFRDCIIVGTVAFVCSSYPRFCFPLLDTPQSGILSMMFSTKKSLNLNHAAPFHIYPGLELPIIFIAKWIMSAIAICLPIPCGCFSCVLIIGAILGRMISCWLPNSIVLLLAPDGNIDPYIGRLALIAAASFAASVTRAFSIVVSVFELVSLPRLVLPMCGSALVSMTVARHLELSIFESITRIKGLQGLPALISIGRATLPSGAVMRKDLTHVTLARRLTKVDFENRVQHFLAQEEALSVVPIVEHLMSSNGEKTAVWLGAVSRKSLSELATAAADVPDHVGLVDALSVAHQRDSLVPALHVNVNTPLKDLYGLAQQEHFDTADLTCFVVDKGTLLGVVTQKEIQPKKNSA